MRPRELIRNRSHLTLTAIVWLGLMFTLANRQFPIVRNSLIYAKITWQLLAHKMRLWEVCSRPDLVLDKACGFPALAAPAVKLLGMNQGLKYISFLGTAAFVLAAYAFFKRVNRYFSLDDRDIPFELAVCCFNPLVIYQFWSAYPDSLFFAGFIASFVILDVMVAAERGYRWLWVAAYFGVVAFSIFIKHWGLLLFPLHAVYIYWHREALSLRVPEGRRRLVAVGAGLLLALAFVGLGRAGLNPLLNLRSNEGQYDAAIVYLRSVEQFVWFLVPSVGLLLLLAPRIKLRMSDAVFAICAIAYAHLLMVYNGATYNARYYIAILPLIAPYFVRACRTLEHRVTKRGVPAAFLVVNAALVLVFNCAPVHRMVTAGMPASWFRAYGYLDSYRMHDHLEIDAALANINAKLPHRARLIYVSSYYGDASHQVYERAGLMRGDLRISYQMDLPKPKAQAEELYLFYPNPGSRPRQLFEAADGLGHGLYRIAPIRETADGRVEAAAPLGASRFGLAD